MPTGVRRDQGLIQRGGASPHLLLGLVFLIALGLRLLHWWGQMRNNPFFYHPTMDEEMHHQWAQRIASGAGLGPVPFFRAPLYYYLLAAIYKLFGPNIALARLLGAVLGAATCYLVAHLGFALAGFAAGLVAGLVAALYWPLVHYDTLLLTPVLEVFLNVLLLLVLMRAAQRNARWLFLVGGIAWGVSALTRPTVLAFAPGIVGWLWLTRQRPGAARRRGPLQAAALLFVGAALAILPVTIRNRLVSGEWVLIASYGGVNFYIGNNPQADGVAAIVPGTRADWQGGYEDTHRLAEQALGRKLSEGQVSSYWFRQGWQWIRANPAAWLRLTAYKFRLFWTPVEIPNNQPDWFFARLSESSAVYRIGFPVVACLGLAGLVLVAGQWRQWFLVLLFGLATMATVVVFFCPGRYRLPAVPVLILLAAAGVTRLPGLWRRGALVPLGAYLVVAALSAVFLATSPPDRAMHERECRGRGHHDLGLLYARLSAQQPQLREQATWHLREAVRFRPHDAAARASLGVWLLKSGRREEAGEQLATAAMQAPSDAEVQAYFGDYLNVSGRLAEAAEQYRKAAELNPTWPDPQRSLGLVLVRLNRLSEARQALEKAVRLRPDDAVAAQALARVVGEQAKPDD